MAMLLVHVTKIQKKITGLSNYHMGPTALQHSGLGPDDVCSVPNFTLQSQHQIQQDFVYNFQATKIPQNSTHVCTSILDIHESIS